MAARFQVMTPPKVVDALGHDFRYGCPLCKFRSFVEIMDAETMSRVVALYCSGCDTQFNGV